MRSLSSVAAAQLGRETPYLVWPPQRIHAVKTGRRDDAKIFVLARVSPSRGECMVSLVRPFRDWRAVFFDI